MPMFTVEGRTLFLMKITVCAIFRYSSYSYRKRRSIEITNYVNVSGKTRTQNRILKRDTKSGRNYSQEGVIQQLDVVGLIRVLDNPGKINHLKFKCNTKHI